MMHGIEYFRIRLPIGAVSKNEFDFVSIVFLLTRKNSALLSWIYAISATHYSLILHSILFSVQIIADWTRVVLLDDLDHYRTI